MKRLIMVRHGKSSWEYDVNDKDRPLQERGINDAHLVAGAFGMHITNVDAVFSSPANRALHTCIIFLRKLEIPFDKLTVTDRLYDFSGESVSQFILGLDDTLTTVMIFGHNNAFTNIANEFGNRSIDNVTTSGLVSLNFNVDQWNSIDGGATEQVIFPKHLK